MVGDNLGVSTRRTKRTNKRVPPTPQRRGKGKNAGSRVCQNLLGAKWKTRQGNHQRGKKSAASKWNQGPCGGHILTIRGKKNNRGGAKNRAMAIIKKRKKQDKEGRQLRERTARNGKAGGKVGKNRDHPVGGLYKIEGHYWKNRGFKVWEKEMGCKVVKKKGVRNMNKIKYYVGSKGAFTKSILETIGGKRARASEMEGKIKQKN